MTNGGNPRVRARGIPLIVRLLLIILINRSTVNAKQLQKTFNLQMSYLTTKS